MKDRDDFTGLRKMGGLEEIPWTRQSMSRCRWGRVQESGVGGCTAIQAAGLIELPCATPSKGAEAGGGVGVSGVAVGVVELLSAIDVGGMEFDVSYANGGWRMKGLSGLSPRFARTPNDLTMALLDALVCRAVAPDLRQILWRGLGMEFNVSMGGGGLKFL